MRSIWYGKVKRLGFIIDLGYKYIYINYIVIYMQYIYFYLYRYGIK